MKWIFSLLFLFSSSAFAEIDTSFKKWEPIDLTFPSTVINAGLEDLTSKNDPYLADIVSKAPQFKKDFPAAVQTFFELAFHTFANPINFPEREKDQSEEKHFSRVSYRIGKYIKNMQIYAMGNAGLKAAPDYSPQSRGKYLFCETHPDDPSGWCYPDAYDENWAVIRRTLSSAKFVDAVCPVIAPLAAWHLNWNRFSPDDEKQIQKFFEEMDRVLDFIYGNGEWSLTRLDQIHSTFDSSMTYVLIRRYMDGGPDFIDSARGCLRQIVDAYESLEDRKDPETGKKIGDILQFKPTHLSTNGPAIDLQSVLMNFETRYRLSHHLTADQPIPKGYEPPAQQQPRRYYDEYLDRIGDFSSNWVISVRRMILQLNYFDGDYSYRSVTRNEFLALLKQGKAPADFKSLCIIENADSDEKVKYYQIDPEGKVEEDTPWFSCDANEVLFVREPKKASFKL